jgi:hypothetical protein
METTNNGDRAHLLLNVTLTSHRHLARIALEQVQVARQIAGKIRGECDESIG